MILNKKERGNDYLVCVCDEYLLGKTLRDNNIELKIKKEFYGEYVAGKEEVISELEKATIINVIGEESVNTLKIVKEIGNIIYIQGVPHAQWIRMF